MTMMPWPGAAPACAMLSFPFHRPGSCPLAPSHPMPRRVNMDEAHADTSETGEYGCRSMCDPRRRLRPDTTFPLSRLSGGGFAGPPAGAPIRQDRRGGQHRVEVMRQPSPMFNGSGDRPGQRCDLPGKLRAFGDQVARPAEAITQARGSLSHFVFPVPVSPDREAISRRSPAESPMGERDHREIQHPTGLWEVVPANLEAARGAIIFCSLSTWRFFGG